MDSIAASYSSSESESQSGSEDDKDHTLCSLPRLPSSIIEKYHIEPDITMKSQKMGTKFWTTFIYMEWRPTRAERSTLTKMVLDFNRSCQESTFSKLRALSFRPLHMSTLGSPLALHISLSQNINFTSEVQRDKLYHDLSRRMQESDSYSPVRIKFEPFYQLLASGRSNVLFLTLPVASHLKSYEISNICSAIKESLKVTFPNIKEKELKELTVNPSYVHMSIGQALNVPQSTMDNLSVLQTQVPMSPHHSNFELVVTNIKFDKNRQVLNIPL